MEPAPLRVSLELALAVYAESLVRGSVAVLGDCSQELARVLTQLGARELRMSSGTEPGPRENSTDLVLIPDLGTFDDPGAVLADARRMVGDEGITVIAATNRDAPGSGGDGEARAFEYYELYDLVAREFDQVSMVARLPFHGVTLAELGEENADPPEVSVDTQLTDADRVADAFVVVAAQRVVRLEPYSIIEFPRSDTRSGDTTDRVKDLERQAELERQIAQAEALATEQARLVAAAEQAQLVAAAEQARLEVAAEHARLETALHERAQAVRALELELDRRGQMIREMAANVEEAMSARSMSEPVEGNSVVIEENAVLHLRLEALALELARREGDAQTTRWRVTELERELAERRSSGEGGSQETLPHPGTLKAALDELDALRKALVQEHDARLRLEDLMRSAPLREAAEPH